MIGQVLLNNYRISRRLDEGGLCKIFVARQLDKPRDVAVKVLKEEFRKNSKVCDLFRREIHIMERFQHPHSVAYLDAGPNDPRGPILVMEYLRGSDLNLLMQRGKGFSPERVGRLLVQLCNVLQAAHDAGIVHRDLKPGNIFVLYPDMPQETVKLMDFGLAQMANLLFISEHDLQSFDGPAGQGTPEYIAPEQIHGNEAGGKSDIYSLGVVLYELLTGRRPFEASTVEELLVAHLDVEPPRFATLGLAMPVSEEIEKVVRACLAKTPEERPSSMDEVLRLYEKALGRRLQLPRQGINPISPSSRLSGIRSTTKQPSLPTRKSLAAAPTPAPAHDRQTTDSDSIDESLEANMPEAIAMVKIKGFLFDLGGEILETLPGVIKVNLPVPQTAKASGGLLGWFSGSKAEAEPGTELELHMERKNPSNSSQLTITLVMRTNSGSLATRKSRCQQIKRELKAYLMG